ncbi:hypothetical protein FOMPIDRAFT_1050644 [Fomitopsis schrenkii]|uniref:Uncharacterized protein n=1 Tax=Fomitopsis schrenkii TaxID=2126942 RepID=S8FCS0_FOMSC|nr:hypothetical protein FOMPIDRAFT_1050644 [Fomitopsis schrenkii]
MVQASLNRSAIAVRDHAEGVPDVDVCHPDNDLQWYNCTQGTARPGAEYYLIQKHYFRISDLSTSGRSSSGESLLTYLRFSELQGVASKGSFWGKPAARKPVVTYVSM